MYLYIKALHVIAVISWFAGLIYLGRLFIYHREAFDKPESEARLLSEQFSIMEQRVWRFICNPAMFLSVLFGGYMLVLSKAYLQGWFHLKLFFILCLLFYHFYAGYIRKRLLLETFKTQFSSKGLRIFNEILTILLVGIVFITITREFFATGIVLLLFSFLVLLMVFRLNKTPKK